MSQFEKKGMELFEYESLEELWNEGKENFGEPAGNWPWECPICGKVQTYNDLLEFVSKDDARGLIGFSCIGRVNGKGKSAFFQKTDKKNGCDYTSGGLFQLSPVSVKEDGVIHRLFKFHKPTKGKQA